MNIVSMAAQYLTPMLVEKIASSLGIKSTLVQKAIAAILPTILASLVGSSAKPDGLRKITDILGKQDTSILGNLGDLLGGSKQSGLIEQGAGMLGSLLGSQGAGALSTAVAKFSGVGEGPAKSLLGLVAPVAMGALAKQQKDAGLDAAGLAKMLMGQKDNIAAAMPSGFADLLKGTGLVDAVAPAVAAPAPAARPTATVHPMPHATTSGRSGSWLPWALALAVLLGGGWYYLSGSRAPSLPAVPAIKVGTQDIGAQFGSVVEGLRGTLVAVKDEASAKTAVPRLQETLKQLDGINQLRGTMPADAKKSLAAYAAQLLPLIRPLIDKALQGSGVAAIAKPVLDSILNRIETMSKS